MSDALSEGPLGNEAQLTPATIVPKLRHFEPDTRAISAVERMFPSDELARVADALADVRGTPPPPAAERTANRVASAVLTRADRPSPVLILDALGDIAAGVIDAIELPDLRLTPTRIAFCTGLVEGASAALADELRSQVELIGTALETIVDFYGYVADVEILGELFATWFEEPEGYSLDQLRSFIEQERPELWAAITSARPLAQKLDAMISPLLAGEFEPTLRVLSAWLESLPVKFGEVLRSHTSAIIAAKGDAHKQGTIIGSVLGPAILEAVLTAFNVANVVKHGLRALVRTGLQVDRDTTKLTGEIVESATNAARGSLSPGDLAPIAAAAEKAAPGIGASATAYATGALSEITKEWGDLGWMIRPDRMIRQRTLKWNKLVRSLTGLGPYDVEFAAKLQLTSSHIIGGKWFEEFPDDFKRVFKNWEVIDADGRPVLDRNGAKLVVAWKSRHDMDTFPQHAEAHTRSGERMSEDLGLVGAASRHSLENEMQAYFAKEGLLPFAGIEQVVAAHRRYWSKQQPEIWKRLGPWFDRVDAAVRAATP